MHSSQPRVSIRLSQTSAVMLRPRWEAHVSHARLVAVHSLWVRLGSLYVPFFSSHSWRREMCELRQLDPGCHKPLWPKSLCNLCSVGAQPQTTGCRLSLNKRIIQPSTSKEPDRDKPNSNAQQEQIGSCGPSRHGALIRQNQGGRAD